MAVRRLPSTVVAALDAAKILGIRAGSDDHNFIGVWVVVAEGRVFVRSYTRKPQGWWRTFLEDPRGEIQVGTRMIRIRAVQVRSERIRKAVDRAYADKYNTPGAIKYVRGFRLPARRATTTELLPR